MIHYFFNKIALVEWYQLWSCAGSDSPRHPSYRTSKVSFVTYDESKIREQVLYCTRLDATFLESIVMQVGYMGPIKNPTNEMAMAFSRSEGTSQTVNSRLQADVCSSLRRSCQHVDEHTRCIQRHRRIQTSSRQSKTFGTRSLMKTRHANVLTALVIGMRAKRPRVKPGVMHDDEPERKSELATTYPHKSH